MKMAVNALRIGAELDSVCQRNHIRRLDLFGSAVRGALRADSDLDLLVEFQPDARIGFVALSRAARELSEHFGRKVDLVPKGGLKPPIRQDVLSSAELIYES
jgi:predicted nucleotidyltransferase